jgi:transposase-like protein
MLQDPAGQNNPSDSRYTVVDLNREFPNDDVCLEYIKKMRWPESVTKCKKCNIERKHSRVTGRKAYACDHCGNHIYPLKGTVFARSSTSLKTWFYVIYLLAGTECEISAKRIQRETGVTYKTAWRMLRQVRQLIVNPHQQSAQSTTEIETPSILRILHNRVLAPAPHRKAGFTTGAA